MFVWIWSSCLLIYKARIQQYDSCVGWSCSFRLQDAVNLVHLFNLVHPQSDVALQSKEATGIDLLKVKTHTHQHRVTTLC